MAKKDFKVKIIKDSVFHSTLDNDPKALFVVMEKNEQRVIKWKN